MRNAKVKSQRSKVKTRDWLLVLLLFLVFNLQPLTFNFQLAKAQAQNTTALGKSYSDQEEPIYVTSDKVEYLDKKKEGEFTGNVRAVQGKLTLTSEKLKVLFDETGQKINQIIATGSVRVTREDLIVISENAVFFNEEQKMVLTGRPQVTTKDNKFSGEKITIFLKEDRIIIDSQVKGLMMPRK
jgi:lipopolysaccharide export system protein LptA